MAIGTDLPNFDERWDYDDPGATELVFRDLLTHTEGLADAGYRMELLTQIARSQGLQQQFDEAHATLDVVERQLAEAGILPRVRYLLERGRVFNSSGDAERAKPLFLEAYELGRTAGEDFYSIDAAHMLGIVEPGRDGLEWNLRALGAARDSGDERAGNWQGSLYNNIGWTYHEIGEYEEALRYFRLGLEWQRTHDRPKETRIAQWTVGRCLRSLGRVDEALELQRENLAASVETSETDGYIEEEWGSVCSSKAMPKRRRRISHARTSC